MKILRLTLHKKAFEVMATGEKTVEYRKPSEWIMSRLRNKQYDAVEFVNGYGANRPRFRTRYLGYSEAKSSFHKMYYNGLIVTVTCGDIIIHLGEVIRGD